MQFQKKSIPWSPWKETNVPPMAALRVTDVSGGISTQVKSANMYYILIRSPNAFMCKVLGTEQSLCRYGKWPHKEGNLVGKVGIKQKVTGVMAILKGQTYDPMGT